MAAAASADDGIFENSGDAGISILFPDADSGNLFFTSPAGNRGQINFIGSTNVMRFVVNTVAAMDILSNADIRLSGGTSALATGATGGFPGIPTMAGDASGAPANESAGFAPIVYDTTNQEFKIYDPVANAWRAIATAAQ